MPTWHLDYAMAHCIALLYFLNLCGPLSKLLQPPYRIHSPIYIKAVHPPETIETLLRVSGTSTSVVHPKYPCRCTVRTWAPKKFHGDPLGPEYFWVVSKIRVLAHDFANNPYIVLTPQP